MNLMHIIDPELVVFGGGMIAAGDGFLDRIRVHVRRLAFPVPAERTRIVYAQLGADAGFIGAAACGRRLVRRVNFEQRREAQASDAMAAACSFNRERTIPCRVEPS